VIAAVHRKIYPNKDGVARTGCVSLCLEAIHADGRIGLAKWTPGSFIGEPFKVLGRYVPPPPRLSSPTLWGTEARLGQLFRDTASSIMATPRRFSFRYCSAAHWLEVFRTFYGSVNRASSHSTCRARATSWSATSSTFCRASTVAARAPSWCQANTSKFS
jgi:hypothetical protein